ncbi:UDP-4-amino-4,6-dideoxy-N-acetyl-beta-L-altrosamine transaminase [Cohnella herbarum]|uniref:UDP-4-amino-4, 6-dideoxy-N-acetyl-beta-L-altrosamine transaminase n=1 Tax=Cohnella herbarum TaxID=2728023 RepID=A0A7Z2VQC7_9BACL|nr:UDP-4-amino-4,6-dideoxy-N-acetyl-beta-L-altrosamine transaminase [Cohnella herbarum]QJD87194.1 UDP-4-amino-4,6-dideoxy-N-acetyl-beta-L-altrosamine transaminase [Cohnella herbarum]
MNVQAGNKKRSTFLPYGRQWIDEKDIEAVTSVLRGDYLTTGPYVPEFESKIAEKVGARYAVAFANGTAALHAACYAAGIGEGDEVITTPITFAASANCVLYQGGKPVFADIDERTYNIDPQSIERLITKRTKAIIPVDFTGQPANLDTILDLAAKYGLVVIEDAAHALGATYRSRQIGSISHMTMFSLHPVKHITAGEGGVITTDNELYYGRLLDFRNHGIVREPSRLGRPSPGKWYYEMQSLGYNYRLTDISAALAMSQLDKLDAFVSRRRRIAETYNHAFRELSAIRIPYQADDGNSSWHLYAIRLDLDKLNTGRDEIFSRLHDENIGVNLHYIPVYLHPYYEDLGYPQGLCKKAESLYESILTLPLYPGMTDQDVEDVIHAVRQVIGECMEVNAVG